jgi:peptidoglycan/xylan/chitin deacetylase (PgdA/CDA1 family)
MSLLLWLLALLLHGDDGKTPIPAMAISGVTTQEHALALTFDACATKKQANGFDQDIFDILRREKLPVTIYMTGTWAETHPGAVKQIAAADWVEVGNHSYSHPRLTLLQLDRLQAQIRYTNRILLDRVGRPALSMRPPAGAWNQDVLRVAHQENLPLVLWSVVSGDAGGHIPAERIRQGVLAQAKPGSIIIFHINKRGPFTHQALPDIIAGLRERGFRFVTVSQLLALPDAVPLSPRPSRMGYGRVKSRAPAPTPIESTPGEGSPAGQPVPDAASPAAPPAAPQEDPAAPRQTPAGDRHENSSG